jgi:hypothetical protein
LFPADLLRQLLGPVPRLGGGVLRAHVACHENLKNNAKNHETLRTGNKGMITIFPNFGIFGMQITLWQPSF